MFPIQIYTKVTCQGLILEGLHIGEGAVTASVRKCHVLAINTTKLDIEVSVSPQEIIPFDFCGFPGKESSDPETENLPEEKGYVFGWAEDYADIFYLNGVKLHLHPSDPASISDHGR